MEIYCNSKTNVKHSEISKLKRNINKKLIAGALVGLVAVGSNFINTSEVNAQGRKEVVRKSYSRMELYVPSEICNMYAETFEQYSIAGGAGALGSGAHAWAIPIPIFKGMTVGFASGASLNKHIAKKLREGSNGSGVIIYGLDCGKMGVLPYKIKIQ